MTCENIPEQIPNTLASNVTQQMLHIIVIHLTENQNIGMMAAQCFLHNFEIIASTFGATETNTNNITTNDGQIACDVHQILTTGTMRHGINETRLKDLTFLRFLTTPKQQTCGNECGLRNDTSTFTLADLNLTHGFRHDMAKHKKNDNPELRA